MAVSAAVAMRNSGMNYFLEELAVPSFVVVKTSSRKHQAKGACYCFGEYAGHHPRPLNFVRAIQQHTESVDGAHKCIVHAYLRQMASCSRSVRLRFMFPSTDKNC